MTSEHDEATADGSGADLLFTRQGLRGPAWLAVLLPGLLLVLLWLGSGAADAALASPASALRVGGLLFGLCGYAAFATDLVLGARIPAVERLFAGLDRMYRFHRRLGAAAGAFLTAHVVLLLASATFTPGGAAVQLLLPDPGWRVFAGVVAFALTAFALTLTALVRLRHEVFLRVHRLLGLAFAVGSVHVLRVPAASGRPPLLAAYVGFLTAAGVVAWVYRSGLGRTFVRRHYYRVADIRPLPGSITEVTLTPVEDPLRFTPGQHVFLGLRHQAVTREQHPFSITSGAKERELRLAVKAVGDFTTALRDVGNGSWAKVEGPYGSFWHNGQTIPRQVWIAGGIGITPFLSMARSLDAADRVQVDLYYCTDDANAAVFLHELAALAGARPALRVIPVPADAEGFLSAERVRERSGDLSGAHIFLCGPPAMIDALLPQFTALGVPRERLHHEDFRLRRG